MVNGPDFRLVVVVLPFVPVIDATGMRGVTTLGPSPRGAEVTAAAWRDAGPTPDGEGRRWLFEITADGFLHNMVRVAVGSMVDVAQGRMSPEAFAAALACGERRRMGQTAPARGLALVAVSYEARRPGDGPGAGPAVTPPGSG